MTDDKQVNKMSNKNVILIIYFYTINSIIKTIFKFPTSAEQNFLYGNDFLETLGNKSSFYRLCSLIFTITL